MTSAHPPGVQVAARILLLAVLFALAGCRDTPGQHPAITTTTVASTTATTAPQTAAGCPLGAGCPRPKVTPGSVIPSAVGVCQTSYNPRRELTAAAKRRVLAAYGLAPGTKVTEWDHLVARWAGGTSTSSNIFPQIDPTEVHRKDRLELALFNAVCRDHVLSLTEARNRMRVFWRWW